VPVLVPARYVKVTTGTAQPAPGGIGMASLGETIIRISLSKIDADGAGHVGLEMAPAGVVLTLVDSTGFAWHIVTTSITAHDYYYDIYGDVANSAGCAAITGDVLAYLPSTESNPGGLWVTGSAILTHVRVTSPSAEDAAWADACALAVSTGIDRMLGTQPDPLPEDVYNEVVGNALTAGGDAYRRRDTPFGLSNYSDMAGIATRVARDYLEGIRPQLERWRNVSDGIA
jgi:hypothetical protein